MIVDMSAKANSTEHLPSAEDEEDNELFKPSPRVQSLRKLVESADADKWAELNAILGSLTFNIPAIDFETDILGLTVGLAVNGTCSNIGVEDILLDWDKGVSARDEVTLAYKVQVLGAKLKCLIEVDWNTGVLDVSDHIKMKVVSNDNNFGIAAQVEGSPPKNSTFLGCKVVLNIGDIASSGGFSSDIINDLNYLIADLLRNEAVFISATVCDLLSGFTDTIDETFAGVFALLDPFIVPFENVDPLYLEDNLDPDTPELVSFMDTSGLGNVVNVLLTNLEGILSADQVNLLVTSLLLDENGLFVLELAPTEGRELQLISDDITAPVDGCFPDIGELLPFRRRGRQLTEQFNDYVRENQRRMQLDIFGDILSNITLGDIIDTEDILVVNTIAPTKVTVAGLNQFSDAQPLTIIGDYTLLTALELANIAIEAELYLDVEVNGIPIQQLVTASVDVGGLLINASYLVGLEQAQVDTWTLGTFLNTNQTISCVVAALVEAGVAQLEVTLDYIGVPVIEGFFSDAADDLANTGIEGVICAYQDLILDSIPGFIQNNVTAIVNEFLDCYIASSNATCEPTSLEDILGPPPEGTEGDVDFDFKRSAAKSVQQKQSPSDHVWGYLDFRDLLLPPAQAKELGGSGRQQYGDLLALGFGTLLETVSAVDNTTGLLGVSDFLPVEFVLEDELINFQLDLSGIDLVNSLLQSVSLAAYHLRLENLNTLVAPLSFLSPTTSAHVLGNVVNFGPTSTRSLSATATVLTSLQGNNSGLALTNEMDMGGSVGEMDLSADFLVMISTADFIQFPIADILNLNCWLALVQAPDQMVNGKRFPNSLEVTRMLLGIIDMQVKVSCLNCTSETLPGTVNLLDRVGAMEVLGNRLGPLVQEIATSDMIPPMLASMVGLGDVAARQCPHSPLFNTTSNKTDDFELELELPPLSNEALDTVMYTGILGFGVFAVVFAETHLDADLPLSDPLSGQASLEKLDDLRLLDWHRLNESFIPLAGDAIDLVKGFLGPTEDGLLGVNGLLGESFNLSLGLELDLIDGYQIVVDAVELRGLDSFEQFDILEPIAPQTLKNTIALDDLTVVMDFSLNATNTSEPAQPYRVTFGMKDVNATIYLFTAVDLDKLEALEVGQLLFVDNILPCMLASAYDVHVPAMRLAIGTLGEPMVEGLMPDTSAAAEASLEAIFEEYGSLMAEAMNSIFDGTIRPVVNDFVQGFITDTSSCMSPSELYESSDASSTELIDFRDLFLTPELATLLGGSGTQPYGDLVSTGYALLIDTLVSDGASVGELLSLNSFIEDFSESQSGVVGMLRLEDELVNFPLDLDLFSVKERIQLSAFDARIRNLNTLVSPIALAQPTTDPYTLENMINFGPIAGKPLNATLGALLEIVGDLTSLNMFNMFDISGELSEIEMVAAVSLHVLKDGLLTFPIRDVFEFSCWFSLFQNPGATELASGASGFKFERLLMKLASLSVDANCLNCTSRVLDNAIALADGAGASEIFGDRLGLLLEDVATSDAVVDLLGGFIALGDAAGRSCPHHPLFNTTSADSQEVDSSLALPALSKTSVDTLLFAGIIFAEIAVVVGADTHVQNPGEPTDPLYHQNALDVPETAKLIDWENLDEVGIPFVADILDLVRGFVSDTTENDAGEEVLGVNSLAAGFLDESGAFVAPLDGFSFEQFGLLLTVKSVRALGLDNFTEFDILRPIAPQTMQNTFTLPYVKAMLDVSIEILDSDEPANELNITIEMEGINASVPVFAAVDETKVGNLRIGQLLFLENALSCILGTTYGVQVDQMLVTVDQLYDPVFEGFLPDTSESIQDTTTAIFDVYGTMVKESIPLVFQDTLRVFINKLLSDFEETECKTYPVNSTTHYIDFRQMFQPANSTAYSPYGDIIPIARELLDSELLAVNPETQMPKINDVLIAPFTEDQSGVAGTLLLPGKIFELDSEALSGLGVGNVGVELFDARIENLDTVGAPLYILEPNATRGDLIDNGATFGTQFSPLRFAIRGTLSVMTPFGVATRDEMDVFGEIRSAPIFAVLLARIGAEEFLDFPLGYATDVNCWLGTLAAPALKEIQDGNLEVSPVLAIHYLNIAFQSMRISASCHNCTTGGLEVVPDLLEILETSTAKNVVLYRNVELILSLLNSDFAQVWITRIFQDSIRQCEYTANSPLIDLIVPNTDFPQLTDYHMETGVFTVTVFIQLGLVILAESVADLQDVEPLLSDPEPEIPPGTRLVDFTELDTFPNGALALGMISGLNSFLGTPEVDEDTGEVSLGINGILGNPIMPFEEFAFDDEFDIGISNLKIKMLGAVVSGLDTFTRFQIANITGPTTMQHELGWKRLQIDIKLEIDVSGNPDLIFIRDLQEEASDGKFAFGLTLELEDVLVIADTMIALDYDLMKELELGQFLRFAGIFPCIQATILHLELTDLVFEIGRVTKMQVSGFTSPDTQTAAENLEETLLEKYGATIGSMAPNLVRAGARPLLNTFIQSYLRESDFECEKFPFDPASGGFIDFRDLFLAPEDSIELGGTGGAQYGDIISTIFGYSNIAIRFFVLPNLSNLAIEGSVFDQGIRFDVRQFKSVFVLKVSDLELENINSVGTLAYTEPVDGEAHVIDNEIKIGIGRKPLGFKARVFIAFKGLGEQLSEVDISNDFEISMDINSLHLILQAFLRVREEDFVRFPLRNVLDLNCWMATIPPPELDAQGFRLPGAESNVDIRDMSVNIKELGMGINCLNCTSQGLKDWNDLLQVPGASEELTDIVNIVINDLVQSLTRGFLQDQIDALLVSAPRQCEHTRDSVDPNAPAFQFNPSPVVASDDTVYLTYLLAIVIPLAFAVILILGVRTIVNKRHKKWMQGLPSERVFLIQQKQERGEHMEAELNEMTSSMYESQEVPFVARYLVPAIVVINIGFFLSGHLNLGGRAMVDITIAGETFRVDNFYEFSIAQSTLDLWHAGGQELATLILLFSGIWPYTKQLITLALWFLPPSVVSVSRRGQFLLWLDLLAKWSMIDIFVLLITVAGFRIGGMSPNYSWLPEEFWNVQLLVIPMWGLYANMIAQLMSQISSHFIVMYHRRIIIHAKQMYKDRHHPQGKSGLAVEQQDVTELLSPDLAQEEKKDQLCKHAFIRPHKTEGSKLTPRRVMNGFLPICALLLMVLLFFACYWPSLKLEVYGAIGIVIEAGTKFTSEAVREESIFSKAKILIDQAKYLDEIRHYIGNGFLAILFIGTLFFVPIMTLCSLMYLWLVPTTRERKARMAITLEILQAWQYVEVYMLGIIIESWQLGSISKLFINRYCESINPTLELMASYGIIHPQNAQCFELAASIAEGAYSLIPFTIGLAIIGTYVFKAYIQTLREQADDEDAVSEEDKLRAFDRTTWDNREGALESIRNPPVLFTDTFRWTLVQKEGTATNGLLAQDVEGLDKSPAVPILDTSSSDEPDGKSTESKSLESGPNDEPEVERKPSSSSAEGDDC